MAEKKFTKKIGYDNLLDYDPVNGILKYGSYEFFASDLIDPVNYQLNFDDYKEQKSNVYLGTLGGIATRSLNRLDPNYEKTLRTDFDKAIKSGSYSFNDKGRPQGPISLSTLASGNANKPFIDYGFERPRIGLADIANIPTQESVQFRKLKQLGPDSYEVQEFRIPNTVDFVDKIAAKSSNIYRNASQDRAILAQNQQDQRNRRQGAAATKLG